MDLQSQFGENCPNPGTMISAEQKAAIEKALKETPQELLKLIGQSFDAVCDVRKEMIEGDNEIKVAVNRISVDLKACQEATALTPDQIDAITEAAGFLIDANGNVQTLGSLVSALSKLDNKVDKTEHEKLAAKVKALEENQPEVDLSEYAKIDDIHRELCSLLKSFKDTLVGAFQKIKEGAEDGLNMVKQFQIPDCVDVPEKLALNLVHTSNTSGGDNQENDNAV